MKPNEPSRMALNVARQRAAHQVFDQGSILFHPFALKILSEGEDDVIRFANQHPSASIGRLFTAEEDTQAPAASAILGYATWVRRYGGDPGVLGRRIELNGRSYQVVGVLPRSFSLRHEVMPTLGNAEAIAD